MRWCKALPHFLLQPILYTYILTCHTLRHSTPGPAGRRPLQGHAYTCVYIIYTWIYVYLQDAPDEFATFARSFYTLFGVVAYGRWPVREIF